MKSATQTLQDVDLRLLRVFQSVVRHGGFSAAQDELGLTVSTVSNHITALEQRLGVKLCHRGRGGFRLTEQGKTIHAGMLDLFGSIETFHSAVGAAKETITGVVEFGAVDALHTNEQFPLAKAIGGFVRTAPQARINLHVASPQELLQGLLTGRFHVILTPTITATSPIESHLVFKEFQQLYCGKGHSLFDLEDRQITREMLSRYPFVGRSYESPPSHVGLNLLRQSEVSYMESTALMVFSGEFLGYLPDHYAEPHIEDGKLRALDSVNAGFHNDFFVCTHKSHRNRGAVHFMKQVIENCSDRNDGGKAT
ncbi:MAG: LysR family transcriptional regulator [Sulfitobacter sp.]